MTPRELAQRVLARPPSGISRWGQSVRVHWRGESGAGVVEWLLTESPEAADRLVTVLGDPLTCLALATG